VSAFIRQMKTKPMYISFCKGKTSMRSFRCSGGYWNNLEIGRRSNT